MYNYNTKVDLSKETINKLFNQQIMKLTKKINKEKVLLESFDIQFNGSWIL